MQGNTLNGNQIQTHFDAFYEDFYSELCKYGQVEEMHVCDNTGDHLVGNVYARFKYEEDAQRALEALNSRWYAARPVYAELSPVTDFREANCRQNSEGSCTRGGMCNFMVCPRTPLFITSFTLLPFPCIICFMLI